MCIKFTTAISLDNPSRGLLDPLEAFEREAKGFWHYLMAGCCDLSQGVDILFSAYADIDLGPFTDTNRQKTRRAHELLRGDGQVLGDLAGPVGRLVVMVGLHKVWFYTLHMHDLGLDELTYDARAQFDKHKLKRIKKAIDKVVSGPWYGVVELAAESGRVHVHVLAAKGACSLGHKAKCRNFLKAVRYLMKKPLQTRQNVMAYLSVVRTGDQGRRYLSSRLTQKCTVADVEREVGFCIRKPIKLRPEPRPQELYRSIDGSQTWRMDSGAPTGTTAALRPVCGWLAAALTSQSAPHLLRVVT